MKQEDSERLIETNSQIKDVRDKLAFITTVNIILDKLRDDIQYVGAASYILDELPNLKQIFDERMK